MKLRSKLIPVMASLGATAVVAPCLTSCGGLNMETHNMLREYYNHVIPRLPTTIYGGKAVVNTYLDDAQWFPSILKDDLLYTFADYVKNANDANPTDYPYEFSKYYLYVQNFDIDKETTKTKFSIIMDVAGTLKNGGTPITYYKDGDVNQGHPIKEFNLTYTISFDESSSFAFDYDESVKDENEDKKFTISLPYLYNGTQGDGMATSIALGYILDNNDNQTYLVDANEKIDFNSTTCALSSAIFYDQFFSDVAKPNADHKMTMLSHYFNLVKYIL